MLSGPWARAGQHEKHDLGGTVLVIHRRSSRLLAHEEAGPGRLAVYGEFGGGNFGNDASLEALVRLLDACGYSAGEMTCFSRGPDVVHDVYGIPGVRIGGRNPSRRLGRFRGVVSWLERLRDLFRMQSLVRPLSHVVVPGTGIVEDGVSRWSMPLDLFWLALACRLQRTKLVIVCVGVGVPRSRVIRFFFRFFLRSATYRSYRDQQSKRAAATLGVPVDGDAVFADLAFGLPVQNLSSPASSPRKIDVCLGVIGYAGGQSRNASARNAHAIYVASMVDLVDRMVARDWRVHLLIGDRGDRPVVEEVLHGIGRDSTGSVSVMRVREFHDVVDALSRCDVLAASRFHNLIGAALAGCPTIALGYSPKHSALQESLGLAEFAHDIASIDVDRLVEQVEELTAGGQTWGRRVRDGVDRMREEIDKQGADLCHLLSREPTPDLTR